MKIDEFKTELLETSNDLSELAPKIINDIEKTIRSGAKDLTKKWKDALELVHHAYTIGYDENNVGPDGKSQKAKHSVQRPTPHMKGGWKQYEALIKYAVEHLAKNRGIKGDWRASDSGSK